MKSTRFSSFLLAACMAIVSVFTHKFEMPSVFAQAVYRTYKRAKDWLVDTIAYGFKLATNGGGSGCSPAAVMLVQAKAFVMRLAKRERPELTGSWRMCPST